MTDNLKYLIRYLVPIDDPDLDRVVRCFKPRSVVRNTVLLSEGEVCKEFYYIGKGGIRTYFMTPQGHEKTSLVTFDCSIGTALPSFVAQKPSFEIIDALEDSELLVISHQDFFRLIDELPAWAAFYRRILEMAFTYENKKIESRVTLSARQRYEQVLKETPFYFQRLSNKVLASFLDMTQETLSRLKSK